MKKTIVQVEFSQSTFELREDILCELGHPVVSLLGDNAARSATLSDVGVIVIGHGAPWEIRRDLISYFRGKLGEVPIISLLRRSDSPFDASTSNCPADNPPMWVRTVREALTPVN